MPILHAPILEQAGFVKGALPIIEYVAQLDGATQYWQLSTPIPVLAGYKVKYKFRCDGGVGNVVYIHGNSAQSSSLSSYVVPSNSQLSFSGSINEKLDGVLFANNSTIQLGVEYEVEFEVNSNKDIATLFRLQNIEKYTAGYIYDLEVIDESGAVVNKIPLTNKSQGATQLPVVGNVSATMVNYSEDVWEIVEPEPVINYAARLNGTDQYWRFTENITIPTNGSIELDLLYDPNTSIDNDYILCSESSTSTSSFFLSREAIGVGGSGVISSYTIDGQAGNSLPYDNKFHTIKYEFDNSSGSIRFLGTRFNIQQLSRGIFKSFRVRDSVGDIIHEIPLTNKDQGATQLPTVGNVSATMIGYTGDEWEEV